MLETKVKNQHPGGHQDAKTEYFFFFCEIRVDVEDLHHQDNFFFRRWGVSLKPRPKLRPTYLRRDFKKRRNKKWQKPHFQMFRWKKEKVHGTLFLFFNSLLKLNFIFLN